MIDGGNAIAEAQSRHAGAKAGVPTVRIRAPGPEKSVLCSMILSDQCIPDVLSLVTASDFHDPAHVAIFRAIERQHRAGQPIDTVLLCQELRELQETRAGAHLKGENFNALLAELSGVEATSAHAKHYAGIIRDANRRNWLHDFAEDLKTKARSGEPIDAAIVDAHCELESQLNGDTSQSVTFDRITCAELAHGDYSLEFLVDSILVKGQPGLLAGPPKGCKTTTLIDLAISLTTGTRFFGRFEVSSLVRVAVMTGESGLATIQETARRISESRGLRLEDNSSLFWYADVPRFGDPDHIKAVCKLCVDNGIVVLVVDPAYLAMPGANADNLMMQGELLRSMAKACSEVGVTLLIAHHTKKNTLTPGGDPLELQDIAWAGFAEFARQWILLNRRERYEEGTGEHRLWLSVGGSAGHSGLYGVDISEGTWSPTTPRWWDVSIENGNALLARYRQEKKNGKSDERDQRAEEKRDSDRTKVWAAMGAIDKPETSSIIAGAARLNGTRTKAALGLLIADGLVREAKVVRENNQAYPGFELTEVGNANA